MPFRSLFVKVRTISVEFVKQSRRFSGTLRDNAPVRPHADGGKIIGPMGSFVCDGNHICDAGTITSFARVTTSVLRGTAQNRFEKADFST